MSPCLLHLKACVNPGPQSRYPSISQHSAYIKLSTLTAGCSHVPSTGAWNHLPAQLGPRYPRRYSSYCKGSDTFEGANQPQHGALIPQSENSSGSPQPAHPAPPHHCNSPSLKHVQTDTGDKYPIP